MNLKLLASHEHQPPAEGDARAVALANAMAGLGDEDTLLVVAHDAVNRVILCRILGLPIGKLWTFRQAPTTLNLLEGPDVEHLEVVPHGERRTIAVAYDLHEHSLQELEGALEDKGFHLETSLMNKMMRALIYYVEETQIHNFGAHDRLLKRSQNEAYTHAWERHLHGDHDDTPPEWREYK